MDFDIKITENCVRVQNNSNRSAKIYFKCESDRHKIYENHAFNSGVWTAASVADEISSVLIEIVLESELFMYLCDMKQHTFVNVPTNLCVKRYQIQPHTISVIISAYKASAYIEETLNSLINNHPPEHYDIVYHLAIDGDDELLELIYRLNLPSCVKVYYSSENQGFFRMANSMASKSAADYLLFFGADDLALPGIFENVEQIKENHILRFCGETFSSQDNHVSEILRPGGVIMQKRADFLDLKGYRPWRCQGDDEYNRRAAANGKIYVDIEQPFFRYRIHSSSLSNNSTYGKDADSVYRHIYRKIISENVATEKWPLPERLHVADNLVRIL